jgi:hypothetical protein
MKEPFARRLNRKVVSNNFYCHCEITFFNLKNYFVMATEIEYEISFYWVKIFDIKNMQRGEWQPAFYNGDEWELCGLDQPQGFYYFDEIGERINCMYQPIRDDT